MTAGGLGTQYATGLSRQGIERALTAAGKDTDHLAPADLGALEDFHTMGRIATGQLAELAGEQGVDQLRPPGEDELRVTGGARVEAGLAAGDLDDRRGGAGPRLD